MAERCVWKLVDVSEHVGLNFFFLKKIKRKRKIRIMVSPKNSRLLNQHFHLKISKAKLTKYLLPGGH